MTSQPQTGNQPLAGSSLTPGAVRVVGFLVAGAALVGLADFAPQAAVGLTLVIGLGVLLTHTDQITPLSALFNAATGH